MELNGGLIEMLLVAIVLLLVVLIWFVLKILKGRESEDRLEQLNEKLLHIGSTQEKMRSDVDTKLESFHRAGQHQFSEAREIIGDITKKSDRLIEHVSEKLGSLDKTNQKIVDFSEQLQGLQDILRSPKQRGVLGEFILEHVLGNVLPPDAYKVQYAFADGNIVDAALFVKDKIIPVDSKFSLENYERLLNAPNEDLKERYEKQFKADVKKRIDETAKYIRPEEDTMDFAFMFIPSEAIYYDLLVGRVGTASIQTQNMIEYAFRDKSVVIVSPTSFLAYLQTVLQGLRALEIEDNARQIKKRVEELSKHWNAHDVHMAKLGKSMSTTVNHFNNAYAELGKVDRDVMRITDREDREIIPEKIERPHAQD